MCCVNRRQAASCRKVSVLLSEACFHCYSCQNSYFRFHLLLLGSDGWVCSCKRTS